MIRRHLYHSEGITDLKRLREEAQEAGEPAVLHLHPYVEEFDGCPSLPWLMSGAKNHEEYPKEVAA